MLDNSEVRAHLRMGEQAVTLLTSMGYRYETPSNAPHKWIAPEPSAESQAVKQLRHLIDLCEQKAVDAYKETVKTAQASDTKGPNWHLVEGMVGNTFRVRPESIPEKHPLREYGSVHFHGVNYYARSIQYERSPSYTGYTVSFNFRTRPYAATKIMRLPLSCAAFQP